MQKSFNPVQFLNQIQSIVPNFCDKCGARHGSGDFEIISQDLDKVVCRLGCSACGNNYLIHISAPTEGVLSARRSQFALDIAGEEIKKFSNIEKIEKEEILDVFNVLKRVNSMEELEQLFELESNDTAF